MLEDQQLGVARARREGSTMVVSTQVRMANDIAAQFRHLPPEAAADALAAHLRQFWEPRMRAQLLAAVEAGVEGIDPSVAAAAAKLS